MTRVFWASTLVSVLAAAVAACQPGEQPGSEYIEDMARGPAYKAFAPNQATRNGITLQHPVAGTIARGYHPFHYGKGDAEAERAGRELTNPFHPDPPTLEKGKLLYETYCLVCHGAQGKGDGPIASKIPPPTSYKSERVMGFLPGRIFHVITLGSNKMPSYAAQLSPEDRWLIITYVRKALQELVEAAPGTPDTPPPAPASPEPAAAPATDTPAAPAPPTTPPAPPAPTPAPAAAGSGGTP
jgi:mono/diheme cytochrome c family protein